MLGRKNTSETQPAILVADASKVTLVTARKLLESQFNVYLAEDGEAAWELLTSIPEITAIFTDQNLPQLDGLSLLARLRSAQDPRLIDLPVIITTSGERNETARRAAVDAGATDFIIKPFDSIDLLTRARAWCNTTQRTATLREQNLGLRELVLLDADTRTGNHDYFLQESVKDRSFCLRHGGAHTLMYIQLDTPAGSARDRATMRDAMAAVAAVIRAKCRREDTYARIDDHAFALSLLHTAPLNARVLAERIRLAVAENPKTSTDRPLRISVSIGISASLPDPDVPAEDMLSIAKEASRAAVRAGGNRVHVDAATMQATEEVVIKTHPVTRESKDKINTHDESHPLINVDAALADTAAFVGDLLPVLQKLSDSERLVLIDRLLLMSDSSP